MKILKVIEENAYLKKYSTLQQLELLKLGFSAIPMLVCV